MTTTTSQAPPARPVRGRRRGRGIKGEDRGFHVINYLVLTALTLAVLYPLLFVISASFSSADAIASDRVFLWPVEFTADAYKTIFDSPRLIIGLGNSLLYTVLGALIGTALTLMAGYALSRKDLPFSRLLTFFFLVPTLFAAGIIPTYLVVRELGLLDTRWAVVLPGVMSVFNLIITRTLYQMNVPDEVLEAAQVDGASDLRFFLQIAVPLSKPIIAVNLLFYGLAQWNGWFNAFIYLNDQDLFPLQLVLGDILSQSVVNPADIGGTDVAEIARRKELFDKLKYALIVIAMAPPLIAYPFVQKHFVRGALIGSLK